MKCLPVNVNIEGSKVLVVGGGNIASRKALSLLEYGANVTVVAPDIHPELEDRDSITVIRREYERKDMDGARLVICATSSEEVNRTVHDHAVEAGILVNVVDQPDICTFIFPSVIKRGELIISVSSGGASPTLAKEIRRTIEEDIGPEFQQHNEFLAEMRSAVKEVIADIKTRSKIAKELADPRFRELITAKGMDAAREAAREVVQKHSGS